jgi:hypothetical protein
MRPATMPTWNSMVTDDVLTSLPCRSEFADRDSGPSLRAVAYGGGVVSFSDASKARNLSEHLQAGGCAFLQGSRNNLAVYAPSLAGFTRTLVEETPAENSYTLSVKPNN